MILRRFMHHIKEQNWFAVGLDVLVVIVGIFLGLQVSEWNDERKAILEEQEYLERLYADLNGTIEDFYNDVAWDVDRLQSQQLILESLRAKKLKPEHRQSFETGLAFLGDHNPIRRRWGTVQELKSSGNLSLLRDVSLREKLAALDAQFERSNFIIEDSAERVIRSRMYLTGFYDVVAFDYSYARALANVNYDFDALAANQSFINYLSDLQVSSEILTSFAIGHAQQVAELRNHLGALLGKDLSQVKGVDFNWQELYGKHPLEGERNLSKIRNEILRNDKPQN